MVLLTDADKTPDVGYIFCALNGVPAAVLDADGSLWATNCMMMQATKLYYRYAIEPGTKNTGFLIFEPPHIDHPILSCDISEATEMFVEMCAKTNGVWILVLQFYLEGKKCCRVFGVADEQMELVPAEDGSELWDHWIIEDPATAR